MDNHLQEFKAYMRTGYLAESFTSDFGTRYNLETLDKSMRLAAGHLKTNAPSLFKIGELSFKEKSDLAYFQDAFIHAVVIPGSNLSDFEAWGINADAGSKPKIDKKLLHALNTLFSVYQKDLIDSNSSPLNAFPYNVEAIISIFEKVSQITPSRGALATVNDTLAETGSAVHKLFTTYDAKQNTPRLHRVSASWRADILFHFSRKNTTGNLIHMCTITSDGIFNLVTLRDRLSYKRHISWEHVGEDYKLSFCKQNGEEHPLVDDDDLNLALQTIEGESKPVMHFVMAAQSLRARKRKIPVNPYRSATPERTVWTLRDESDFDLF